MSNFLHAAGTNGFITTPVQLLTSSDTGLNGLLNGGAVLSSGTFNQASFGSAQLARLWFKIVAAGFTPTAGGNLAGWWLPSPDGGTTFEAREATPSATVPALGRAPDFIINLYEGGAALAANDMKFSGVVPLPYESFKVLIQNNSGVTLGAGAHLLFCGPVADTFG